MELEDIVVYGIVFKFNEIDKTCMAYKEFLSSGIIDWHHIKEDFINYYLDDKFGNFYFGYHKPTDTCFLSLEGINSETNLTMIDKSILNDDLKKELEEIGEFIGKFNIMLEWHFLSDNI